MKFFVLYLNTRSGRKVSVLSLKDYNETHQDTAIEVDDDGKRWQYVDRQRATRTGAVTRLGDKSVSGFEIGVWLQGVRWWNEGCPMAVWNPEDPVQTQHIIDWIYTSGQTNGPN